LARIFYDADADPAALRDETVAVLGYGIQGRPQALTLRDSGVTVIVGNRADAYRDQADRDGFDVLPPDEAVRRGTIILLLLPDEVQAEIFERDVKAGLTAGKALVFAHGFAIRYRLIVPPSDVDCLLLAPRLPGHYLRERYLGGWGVPAFVSVEHDATGRAWSRLLALAHALGVTRCGAIEVLRALHLSPHLPCARDRIRDARGRRISAGSSADGAPWLWRAGPGVAGGLA